MSSHVNFTEHELAALLGQQPSPFARDTLGGGSSSGCSSNGGPALSVGMDPGELPSFEFPGDAGGRGRFSNVDVGADGMPTLEARLRACVLGDVMGNSEPRSDPQARYLPGYGPAPPVVVEAHASRNPLLPTFEIVKGHPLWPRGDVYLYKMNPEDAPKLKDFNAKQKIPYEAQSDAEVFAAGWIALPEMTAVFCRRTDGSGDPLDDLPICWWLSPATLESLCPKEVAQLRTLQQRVLGDPSICHGAKKGGVHFERSKRNKNTKQGKRCYSLCLSVQAMTDQVQPCANTSRAPFESLPPGQLERILSVEEDEGEVSDNDDRDGPDNDDAEEDEDGGDEDDAGAVPQVVLDPSLEQDAQSLKLIEDLNKVTCRMSVKMVELGPKKWLDLLNLRAEVFNTPHVGDESNKGYFTNSQLNVAAAVSAKSKTKTMKSSIGNAGTLHIDKFDDLLALTAMIPFGDLPGLHPGRFFLAALGLWIPLEFASGCVFTGLQQHGASPPRSQDVSRPPRPQDTRLNFVWYCSQRIARGMGCKVMGGVSERRSLECDLSLLHALARMLGRQPQRILNFISDGSSVMSDEDNYEHTARTLVGVVQLLLLQGPPGKQMFVRVPEFLASLGYRDSLGIEHSIPNWELAYDSPLYRQYGMALLDKLDKYYGDMRAILPSQYRATSDPKGKKKSTNNGGGGIGKPSPAKRAKKGTTYFLDQVRALVINPEEYVVTIGGLQLEGLDFEAGDEEVVDLCASAEALSNDLTSPSSLVLEMCANFSVLKDGLAGKREVQVGLRLVRMRYLAGFWVVYQWLTDHCRKSVVAVISTRSRSSPFHRSIRKLITMIENALDTTSRELCVESDEIWHDSPYAARLAYLTFKRTHHTSSGSERDELVLQFALTVFAQWLGICEAKNSTVWMLRGQFLDVVLGVFKVPAVLALDVVFDSFLAPVPSVFAKVSVCDFDAFEDTLSELVEGRTTLIDNLLAVNNTMSVAAPHLVEGLSSYLRSLGIHADEAQDIDVEPAEPMHVDDDPVPIPHGHGMEDAGPLALPAKRIVRFLETIAPYALEGDTQHPLRVWVDKHPNQHCPFRNSAPSRSVILNPPGRVSPFHASVVRTRAAVFSIILMRASTMGTALLERDKVVWFDTLEDWKCLMQQYSSDPDYFLNTSAYGQPIAALKPADSNAPRYWDAARLWLNWLKKNPSPSFTAAYNFIRETRSFFGFGELLAMVLTIDFCEAEVVMMPTDREFARWILKLDKGFAASMKLLNVINANDEGPALYSQRNIDVVVKLYHEVQSRFGRGPYGELLRFAFIDFEHTGCKIKRAHKDGERI